MYVATFVVDPFLGSGSTLIAADKTGRVCRGVELDPLYVDVIVRRFEAATGNQAVLVETGETFEALATQGAGTGVGLRPAPAAAHVADEPPRNGRLLPVKRAGACTAEVRGSNVRANRRDFLRHRIARHFRHLRRQQSVCQVYSTVSAAHWRRVRSKVSGRKFPFPELLTATARRVSLPKWARH